MASTISILMIFISSLFSFHQSGDPESKISVQGSATLRMPVDYIIFSVSYFNENPDVKNLERTSYAEVLKIKKVLLEEIGLPDSLVETTDSRIQSISHNNTFRFSQTMTVHLDSLELYDAIKRMLFETGANEIRINEFGTYNEKKYRQEAFQRAYANALEQARLLAKSSNMAVGDPLHISTTERFSFQEKNDVATPSGEAPDLRTNMDLESTIIRKTQPITAIVDVQFKLIRLGKKNAD